MGLLNKVKDVLGTVAPLIGSSLGGPLGGVAMKFLADKFTGGDTGKVEDFILAASPTQLVELKNAELEYKKFIEELGLRKSQLEVQDRGDARSLAKERGVIVQAALSALYTVGFFLALFLFMTGKAVPLDGYKEMVMTLIGTLSAVQVQILNFWFGSSRGSARKTDIMANGAAKAVS